MRKGRTWRKRKKRTEKIKDDSLCCQADYISLRKWMKVEGNFKSPYLIPHTFPETGRGLMTVKRLKVGDLLVSVPAELIITSATVLSSDIGHFIKKCDPPLSAHQALAVFLLSERAKGPKSFWFPYLRLLPVSFDTPAFWSPAIVNRLPPLALVCAHANLHTLHNAYAHVHTCCKSMSPHLATLLSIPEDFFWAWFAVNSRCVYMEVPPSPFIQEAEKNYALVPFLDLLNHSPDAQVSTQFNQVTQSFEIVTLKDCPKYGQAFIKYGCHSNTELILEYGFTIPHNPYNVYDFPLDDILTIAKKLNLSCLEQKEKILRTNQFDTGLTCAEDEAFSWKLLVVVHILFLTWPQLQNWKNSTSTVSLSGVCGEGKYFAMTLIESAIEKLQSKPSQNDQQLNDNTQSVFHKELCMALWQDNITILKKAQEILNSL